jgi:dihydroneopterin aldolase
VSDRIEARGLRVLARCGVLPEEQERDQPFELDLVLEVDLASAGATDDLALTVDYGAVVERAVAACAGPCALMERLATRVADAVLRDAGVEAVEVTVRKLRPPVPHDLASAGVSIRRSRG